MKKLFVYLVIIVFAYSCANNYKAVDKEHEVSLDALDLDCANANRKTDKSEGYPVCKIELNDNKFNLEHNGRIFFRGNYTKHRYSYEGFKSKYVFITPVAKLHMAATLSQIPRDSVFLYDLKSQQLFRFSAKGFWISFFKPKTPYMKKELIENNKKEGYKLVSFVDSVAIESKKLYLLLPDFKSREVVSLEPVQ